MAPSPKRTARHADPSEEAARDQEVLRANKELAAYFKGLRTEREARSALKIIKAFVRGRERADPATRRPLPGARSAKMAPAEQKLHRTDARRTARRRRTHDAPRQTSKAMPGAAALSAQEPANTRSTDASSSKE
jgi:hypothetical protein